ncbi:MAG: hypothetical protein Q3983_03810 [Capnocytophaga sp.]|nr:hypothetical protein [Capnocytophaga sp.]
MHLKQVDSVMRNKPIYIMNNEPQYLFLYYYKNNTFGVSDDLCIVFSMKDSLVTHIYYGD